MRSFLAPWGTRCRFAARLALALMGALLLAPAHGQEVTAGDRQHWAFRPPVRPEVPRVAHGERMRTPIDAFLLAKLEARGLTFSPDADRITLARRAHLDLLGLPPSPDEVDAFLADEQPGAYERLLDRLLASSHFGERWARHWLDVVGYADTVGFDSDATTILQSAGKWRYRDYVIAALNRDKPFDRFVTEQLAGDELVGWRHAPRFTEDIRELLIATGYLRTARDQTHEPESNIPLCYYGVLHDTVAIVGNSLLGLTLHCVQCHSHKFDPIPQKDYYRLMAVFTPAYNPQNWKPVHPWKPEIKDRGVPDVSPAEQAEIERHNRDLDSQVGELHKRLADLRRPYEQRLGDAKLRTVSEPIRADTVTAVQTPADKRTEVQKYLAGKFEARLRVRPEEVASALNPVDRAATNGLNDQIAQLQRRRRSFGTIQALYDVGPPPPTHLLKRGAYEKPSEEVQPGFLSVLTDPDLSVRQAVPPAPGGGSGRRTALARWLTEPESRAAGLLARVMVNRLWQHLYGQGIVSTPENFGRSGAAPTHPEFLEWLSSEFARGGWRIKPMLKLMMTSTAYRQASRPTSLAAADPGNALLGRMRLRRLEAEAIRDAILAVSGQLDRTMGGPPILVQALPDGMVVIDDHALPSPTAKGRRSVYLLSRRAYNLSLLTVFDQPLVAVNCPGRDVSAIPLQSLAMLNDGFVAEQARYFADRVTRIARGSRDGAIRTAFRLALARSPTAGEMAICSQLLDRQAAVFRAAKRPGPEAEHLALVQLCHTLLNTSEFLYVE